MAQSIPPKRDGWLIILYLLLLVAGLVVLALGVIEFVKSGGNDSALVGLGVLCIAVPAALYPIASVLAGRGGGAGSAGGTDGNDRMIELLESMNERILLSDTAKRVAGRQEDLETLRRAVKEDIANHDYDAAIMIVQRLAEEYGYREEAEEFRTQIRTARRQDTEAKVTAAIDRLEELLGAHDWDAAAEQAGRIQRLYPEHWRAHNLTTRVADARVRHKGELERQFLDAAGRDDVDRAMELLRELDKYLTEREAEPFRETARGVIGKKRENLGVQFKLAVHDREWITALRVGEQIIREFPNTKMTQEVRDMMDLLRERAAGEQAAHPRQPA